MMNIFFSPTFILVKKLHSALQEIFQCRQKLIHTHYTRSLNDDFEIKNELKKLHIEPFSYMGKISGKFKMSDVIKHFLQSMAVKHKRA